MAIKTGEIHASSNHLVPNVFAAVTIFGRNFKTKVLADMLFSQKVKEPQILSFQTISRRV